MALNDIKAKVMADAQAEAKKINNETQEQINKLEADAKAEITGQQNRELAKSKQKALNRARSILISAKMAKKNALLEKKKDILNKVFFQAQNKLAQLDDDQYKKILANQMKKLAQINLEKSIIIAPQGKSALVRAVADQTLTGNFTMSAHQTDKIKSGFIVKSGETIIDFSFTNLVNEIRSSLEGKVAKELF